MCKGLVVGVQGLVRQPLGAESKGKGAGGIPESQQGPTVKSSVFSLRNQEPVGLQYQRCFCVLSLSQRQQM